MHHYLGGSLTRTDGGVGGGRGSACNKVTQNSQDAGEKVLVGLARHRNEEASADMVEDPAARPALAKLLSINFVAEMFFFFRCGS